MARELFLVIDQNLPLPIFLWNFTEYVYFLDHIMVLNYVTTAIPYL